MHIDRQWHLNYKTIIRFLWNILYVLENYSKFLGFFKGASDYYSTKNVQKNKNSHPEQSEKVMQKLKEEMKIDIELYDFVVQSFNAQLQYVTQNINFSNDIL